MSKEQKIEKRTAELRASTKPMVLEGYAAVFNSETQIADFRERIAPGAFGEAIKQDVRFLLNHDGVPFARSSNGSLQLTEDEQGLHYRAELLDTQAGRDLYAMVQRGDLNESSFAFTIAEEDWEDDLRTIRSVGNLYDVSVTTFGAYSQTSAEARNKKEEPKNEAISPELPKLQKQVRKMKNYSLNDLQALREQKQERHSEMLQGIDDEGREPTADEMTLARSLHKEIASLDKQIELKRQSEEHAKSVAYAAAPSRSEFNEIQSVNKRFSLTRAIRNAMAQRAHTGAEAEWQQERKAETMAIGESVSSNIGIPAKALMRAAAGADNFLAQGQGDGQGFVPTNVPGAIEALRAPAVIEQIGTTVISGATGNIQFPRISTKAAVALTTATGTDGANLDAEIGDAGTSGMAMDEVTLKPQRAAAFTAYSRLLIEQGGADVERVISADLAAAMNAFIDDYCFDKILNDCTTGAITTGTITADDIYALEASVVAQGADLNGARLVSGTDAHSILRGLAGVDAVSALLPQYNYTVTPYLAKASAKPFAYGNFGQAGILALFGGIDLLADVYGSNATAGKVTLHVNRFFDFATRQPAAVACYTGNNS